MPYKSQNSVDDNKFAEAEKIESYYDNSSYYYEEESDKKAP